MKKILGIIIITALLLGTSVIYASADEDPAYKAIIEASSDSFKVGDEFYIKISLADVKCEDGFIGYEFNLKFDPALLEVIENEDGSFAEATLPEIWESGSEKAELLEKDTEGKQTGKIKLVYIAPLETENLNETAVKDNSFFVNVKFRCISESDKAGIVFDGDNVVNCTAIDEDGKVYNVAGAAANLNITINGDGSGIGGTLICIIAAVVVVAAITAAAVIIKKKKAAAL